MAKAFDMWTWREKLKSGAFKNVYVHARRLKRQMRGEPLEGTLPFGVFPVSQSEIRANVSLLPDEPRLYFSLALGYLEAGSVNKEATALVHALACMRCAEAVGFPSPERTALYKAVCAHRRGLSDTFASVAHFANYEFTTEENQLRAELSAPVADVPGQSNDTQAESPLREAWEALAGMVAESGASSLLVAGDPFAVSADWLPNARYLLMEPDVTALTPDAIARLGLTFEVGVAPVAQQQQLRAAGVTCTRWITVEIGAYTATH